MAYLIIRRICQTKGSIAESPADEFFILGRQKYLWRGKKVSFGVSKQERGARRKRGVWRVGVTHLLCWAKADFLISGVHIPYGRPAFYDTNGAPRTWVGWRWRR